MKICRCLILLTALWSGPLLLPQARAEVDFNFFYSSLDPYGSWVEVADYGYCWQPSGVSADWGPYIDGQWVYTNRGWTWVSNEPWGAVTYHYGRWANLVNYGWVWVPGYDWAPAWVSFRTGPDYIGWAPLPPAAVWSVNIRIGSGCDYEYGIGPGIYRFVRWNQFGVPNYGPVVIDRSRNVTIINETTNVTNIYPANNVVQTFGPDFNAANQLSQRRLRQAQLVTEDAAADLARAEALQRFEGDTLRFAAPRVRKPENVPPPKNVKEKIEQPVVDRGWRQYGEGEQVAQARQQIRRQAEEAKQKGEAKPGEFTRKEPERGPEIAAPGDQPQGGERERQRQPEIKTNTPERDPQQQEKQNQQPLREAEKKQQEEAQQKQRQEAQERKPTPAEQPSQRARPDDESKKRQDAQQQQQQARQAQQREEAEQRQQQQQRQEAEQKAKQSQKEQEQPPRKIEKRQEQAQPQPRSQSPQPRAEPRPQPEARQKQQAPPAQPRSQPEFSRKREAAPPQRGAGGPPKQPQGQGQAKPQQQPQSKKKG